MINHEDIHEACVRACLECPNIEEYDFDFVEHRTILEVLQYWKGDTEGSRLLWKFGYSDYLPVNVQKFFNDIDLKVQQVYSSK